MWLRLGGGERGGGDGEGVSAIGAEPEAEAGGEEDAEAGEGGVARRGGEEAAKGDLEGRPVEARGIEGMRGEIPGGCADGGGEVTAGAGAGGLIVHTAA